MRYTNKELINTIIKYISVSLLVLSIIVSFLVSIEIAHIDSCHDDDCLLCSMIHTAIGIINNICRGKSIHIIVCNVLLINIMRIKLCKLSKKTLISENVRLNE